LTENVFKRISANSKPNFNPSLNPTAHPNLNPNPNSNPKAHKPFRENEMTSFFGQVSRYNNKLVYLECQLNRPRTQIISYVRIVVTCYDMDLLISFFIHDFNHKINEVGIGSLLVKHTATKF